MSQPIVSVRGLGKCYQLGELGAGSLRDEVGQWWRSWRGQIAQSNSVKQHWAVRDVSFDVMPGQVVGVIGKNGAGKSTLFKLLSRITEPTEGEAFLYGRVASLLEVGTGFHPELTGRDNIYLSGIIMGMTRSEINARFDEIVAFAGVEKYLDTPVKRYSSGMYVRLGFSVAAHLLSEILIIDEVLAVGDVEFQERCLGKMKDVARTGRTVLFVSHNMSSVQNLCDSAIWFQNGTVHRQGTPEELITDYVETSKILQSVPLAERADRNGSGAARITALKVTNANGADGAIAPIGEVYFEFEVIADHEIHAPVIACGIYDSRLSKLIYLSSDFALQPIGRIPGKTRLRCRIPGLPLNAGDYQINASLHSGNELLDRVEQAARFQVQEFDFFGNGKSLNRAHGAVLVPQEWCVSGEQGTP